MRVTIYRRMVGGFGVIILAMAAVAAYLLVQLQSVSTTVRGLLASEARAIALAKQLPPILDDQERYAQKYLVTGDTAYAQLWHDAALHFREQADSLRAIMPDRRAAAMLRLVQRSHAALYAQLHRDTTAARAGAIADSLEALRQRIDRVVALAEVGVASSMEALDSDIERTLNLAAILTLCAMAGVVATALLITRSITRPLRLLREGTERVARGDFTPISTTAQDEIGALARAFNTMSAELLRLNEQRAELMQQISHELRVPLQTILSGHYLLAHGRQGPVTDAQRTTLDAIRASVDRIADFANQFLDIAKIEAGMTTFQRRPTDLREILGPVVDHARIAAASKAIAVVVDARAVPPVIADPEKIQQVINNLLNNAVKYTAEGGTVSVSLAAEGPRVRLAVRDTGIGIDPDDLPRLFTKFFQARSRSRVTSKGTGLGLALVRAIVEEHGGRVWAASTLGKGSTFTFELPAAGQPEGGTGNAKT